MVAVRKLICSAAWSGLRWDFHYTNVAKEIWPRCNEMYSRDWVHRGDRNPHLRCQVYQGCRFYSLTRFPLSVLNLPLAPLPFLHLSASDLLDAKRRLSVSGTRCWLISDGEADIQAERQIVGKTWPLECFADILSLRLSLVHSFIPVMSLDQAAI